MTSLEITFVKMMIHNASLHYLWKLDLAFIVGLLVLLLLKNKISTAYNEDVKECLIKFEFL